jgi:hypothetical protein
LRRVCAAMADADSGISEQQVRRHNDAVRMKSSLSSKDRFQEIGRGLWSL